MIMFTGLLVWEYHGLHMKNRKICNKTRLPPASLLFEGQGTEHATVKWPIALSTEQRFAQWIAPSTFWTAGAWCVTFILILSLGITWTSENPDDQMKKIFSSFSYLLTNTIICCCFHFPSTQRCTVGLTSFYAAFHWIKGTMESNTSA